MILLKFFYFYLFIYYFLFFFWLFVSVIFCNLNNNVQIKRYPNDTSFFPKYISFPDSVFGNSTIMGVALWACLPGTTHRLNCLSMAILYPWESKEHFPVIF